MAISASGIRKNSTNTSANGNACHQALTVCVGAVAAWADATDELIFPDQAATNSFHFLTMYSFSSITAFQHAIPPMRVS